MGSYILKRLLLMIPTLFVILLINFVVVQIAPGGPVEQAIHQAQSDLGIGRALSSETYYQGAQGLSPEMIEQIKAQYGFDRSAPERFFLMLKGYLTLDFGQSFFKDKPVVQLLWDKMPVSISLGLVSTFLIYLISIPLGIKKARQQGSWFDRSTSLVLVVGYAVPSFVFAILLVVFFAGGSYFQWFPLQNLVSDNFHQLSLWGKVTDYLWHMTLPLITMVLGGFASLTYLTKYSFLEELNKPYVLAAYAKGLNSQQVLYKHVFRNAILVVLAGLPEVLAGIFFVGNLFVEIIFHLDGVGLLGFEAIVQRDYPVIFGVLFFFTLFSLILRLICDVLYQWIDPRVHFDAQGGK
ncbi:microcin C ABC transporter permease YejB [Acinetobacter calcoaceticus]|uniref:microcin C ABC transporter permease YejB n=1 Tax=Acinetobacter calcoaceticus TaxID=471 RepID=UPI001AEA0527|nr:ABC transporter permease subunit [Acinetobacter calcoaceticus]MBP2606058.1 microcin C transport system permease protein [Acinetobacter calcoaceticus]